MAKETGRLLTQEKAAELLQEKTGRSFTQVTVSGLVKRGVLSEAVRTGRDGKKGLDSGLVVDCYLRNAQQHKRRSPSVVDPKKVAIVESDGATDDGEPIPDISQSNKERAHYEARIAKAKMAEAEGAVTPNVEIKRQAFEFHRKLRDGLVGIPDRVASELASETDSRVIHRVLLDEITAALKVLSGG